MPHKGSYGMKSAKNSTMTKNGMKTAKNSTMSKKSTKSSSHKETIAKGTKVAKKKAITARKKPGGSNVGKYKGVSLKEMAGPAGGAPKGSYHINTLKRARAALAYAHNAPSPAGIKRAVYAKYPSLKKAHEKRMK